MIGAYSGYCLLPEVLKSLLLKKDKISIDNRYQVGRKFKSSSKRPEPPTQTYIHRTLDTLIGFPASFPFLSGLFSFCSCFYNLLYFDHLKAMSYQIPSIGVNIAYFQLHKIFPIRSNKMRKILSIIFLLIIFCFPVSAAVILDQYQLISSWPYPLARFDQDGLAQSFIPTGGNIAGAGISLSNDANPPGAPDSQMITISVWDALPTQAGAHNLGSFSGMGTKGSWFDLYWTPIPVTPGIQYYLVFFSATPPGSSTNWLGIEGSATNSYLNGQCYAGMAGTPFQSFPEYDYTFRTYYDDAFTPGPGAIIYLPLILRN
jgi:hypothetical protein